MGGFFERFRHRRKIEEKPAPQKIDLTEPEFKQFFYLSFRISQGNLGLQRNLFQMIHALHPELSLPTNPEIINSVRDHTANMFIALHEKHMHTPVRIGATQRLLTPKELREMAQGEANTQMRVISGIFGMQPENIEDIRRNVFNEIITRDLSYLLRSDGRKHDHPKGDSWSSDFMKYIKPKEMPSTGNVFFDEVFEEMRRYYKEKKWKEDTTQSLTLPSGKQGMLAEGVEEIQKLYRQHHPSRFVKMLQRVGYKRQNSVKKESI